MFGNPSVIDLGLDSRAITFENPAGAKSAAASTADGRKGAPSRIIRAGERVELADIVGPGTIGHIWCTVPPAPPEVLRGLVLEVHYDDLVEPSISVPLLDFFGVACGRPTAFTSALTAVQEGRGFNSYIPIPFRDRVRFSFVNGSAKPTLLYYQLDYTLGPVADDVGLLHVSFRRENPTTMRCDFVIADGWSGPGRFLGCVVGVRPIDSGRWYGEGEVKVFLDDDFDAHNDLDPMLPTIAGTGLEDYVGSAWGLGEHHALFAGAPLDTRPPGSASGMNSMPAFVGFYRWHVPDPIVFRQRLRVTIQQIGMNLWIAGQEDERDAYLATNPLAGNGWFPKRDGVAGMGLFERVDDYSAAAFVYLTSAQPTTPVDIEAATADLSRRDFETADPMESMLG